MFFYSIKKKSPLANFETVLFQGLAPDGGLYFPKTFPQFSQEEILKLRGKTLKEIGSTFLVKWLSDEISTKDVESIIDKSLNFPLKLVKVGPYYVLELYHGPTMSFKDFAARTLANLMDFYLKKRKKLITLLVATSGDTGGAVAQGFSGAENIKVFVLYPKGKVSKVQEEQLTRVSSNVNSLEIEGSFDDCQSHVKKALIDSNLSHLNSTSANSINIGRLIPQSIYYLYVILQLNNQDIEFIVPSGNMGNVTSGIFLYKMGFKSLSFVIATNSNASAEKYYKSGLFKKQETIPTLSNAMDVGNPSNFIRILELFNHNRQKFKEKIKVVSISDSETINTIKKVYRRFNYLLDPHSAVGWAAANKIGVSKPTQIIFSTASPAKFAEEISQKTGIRLKKDFNAMPFMKNKKRKISLDKSYKSFKNLLLH